MEFMAARITFIGTVQRPRAGVEEASLLAGALLALARQQHASP
jgi:hypothetical protein